VPSLPKGPTSQVAVQGNLMRRGSIRAAGDRVQQRRAAGGPSLARDDDLCHASALILAMGAVNLNVLGSVSWEAMESQQGDPPTRRRPLTRVNGAVGEDSPPTCLACSLPGAGAADCRCPIGQPTAPAASPR